jgi:hypothetical protein
LANWQPLRMTFLFPFLRLGSHSLLRMVCNYFRDPLLLLVLEKETRRSYAMVANLPNRPSLRGSKPLNHVGQDTDCHFRYDSTRLGNLTKVRNALAGTILSVNVDVYLWYCCRFTRYCCPLSLSFVFSLTRCSIPFGASFQIKISFIFLTTNIFSQFHHDTINTMRSQLT